MMFLKQKKVILLVLAVLFVGALFFSKNKDLFTGNRNTSGLAYNGNETISDLVEKDTDKDGIADWEESLYGTDPTKKDTNEDGVPDNIEIERRRGQNPENGELNLTIQSEENLNNTDRLSRELFSTIAALNQAGNIDQNTINTLSDSLIKEIQDSGARKIFIISDLKVVNTENNQMVINYYSGLDRLLNQNRPQYTVMDVLQKFVIDENNVDTSVLSELDPLITWTNRTISGMADMSVPKSLASLHLNMLNALQKLSENMSDIRMYESDTIVAMRGISQYSTNAENLVKAMEDMTNNARRY